MFVDAGVFHLEVVACSLKKVHRPWPNKYLFKLQQNLHSTEQEHKSHITSSFHIYPHAQKNQKQFFIKMALVVFWFPNITIYSEKKDLKLFQKLHSYYLLHV
jgi:hypothetical protein